ncbi:MAG TPA: VIT family protein [Nocardioides sp.]|uniref:VIT1/CCC1 transporter family protein n=1 Tax=Nocardioides sp. TaxID=35761 RepID=UPI002E3428D6|nr:VIT family protein [Nocardioides sp.]HEX3929670.1 VIT family protein [Nocardioides sp.]
MSTEIGTDEEPSHWHDDIGEDVGNRLNWLRAGVLGANDGIVSVAGIVMGVAGATSERSPVLVAGIAGLVAGALSMAAGEYVSVSTQLDSERAMLAMEAEELERMPKTELRELAQIYERKGLSHELAQQVASQLTEHDALGAHAEAEFGIDKDNLTNPWSAALASMVSFTVGALLPLLVITLAPHALRIWSTVVAVAAALGVAGFASARLGYSPWGRAVLRNVGGGLVAMGITYAVGAIVGPHV